MGYFSFDLKHTKCEYVGQFHIKNTTVDDVHSSNLSDDFVLKKNNN